jgi:fumarate reductase flavoprotein subunit
MQSLKVYAASLALLCATCLPAWSALPENAGGALAKKHTDAGVTCKQCHTAGIPVKKAAVSSEVPRLATKEACLKCHGSFKELSQKTANYEKPFNPHYSHYGELNCYTCHRVHQTSELFCTSCHMEMKVPKGWKAAKVPSDE